MGTWLDEMTEQLKGKQAVDLVAGLNRKLRGWANHFCLGPVSKAYRAVDRHTRQRLRHWLCRKNKLQTCRGRKPEHLVRKPYAGKPPVRFEERDVETEVL